MCLALGCLSLFGCATQPVTKPIVLFVDPEKYVVTWDGEPFPFAELPIVVHAAKPGQVQAVVRIDGTNVTMDVKEGVDGEDLWSWLVSRSISETETTNAPASGLPNKSVDHDNSGRADTP